MTFIRRIKAKGRIYLAEVENKREAGKVRQKIIRYLGRDNQSSQESKKGNFSVTSTCVSGSVLALNWIADQIGLHAVLGEHAQPILTLIYAHCHHYRSVSQVANWYEKTDLKRVFGVEEMPDHKLREAIYAVGAMDLVAMQKSIFQNLMEFTGNDTDSVIYDVTNTYFTGRHCKLAKVGLDKEGVHGRRLIQIGLAITKKHGFPIFHQLHPGNISDSKIFGEAIVHLKRFGFHKGLIVYDRGMTSKVSILELSNQRWKVVAGMPMHRGVKEIITKMDLKNIQNVKNRIIQGDTIFYAKAKKYQFGESSGKLLVLLNPEKKAVQKEERINTALEIRAKAMSNVELTKQERGLLNKKNKINSHALKRAERFDGLSCVFTNSKLSLPDIVHTYFERGLIEASFRGFKSMLALRPVRMWMEDNVAVHILICHLAYALKTTLRFLLDQKRGKPGFQALDGISYEEAFDELTDVYRVYFKSLDPRSPQEALDSRLVTLSKRQDTIIRAISSTLTL